MSMQPGTNNEAAKTRRLTKDTIGGYHGTITA
jgi:hypothetical protein